MKKNPYTKIAKDLRKQVEKDFGKKCDEFTLGCAVCIIHAFVENVELIEKEIDYLNK